MWTALVLLLLAYIPGALLYRIPLAGRETRAALPAEERAFWALVLSLSLTLSVALGLAIGGRYTFASLLRADAGVALLVVLLFRHHLRLGPTAPLPTRTALLPIALVAASLFLNFRVPPAEYIMGGRDPGVYMTEGIRIAQRGGIAMADEVVSTVPPTYRDLFFPRTTEGGYYSNRFMGYFLLDPAVGTVVGQFPLGFPVVVALGYGVNGLSGARAVAGFCGAFGVLAVFFLGTRLLGRAAGLAGAGLLAVHVVQLWYSRYPNAEILLQPLAFAGLLAYVRSHRDGHTFFAPVAALLFVLGAFTHLTGTLAAICLAMVGLLDVVARRGRVRFSFWIPLVGGTIGAAVYLSHFIPPYFDVPRGFIQNLGTEDRWGMAVAGALAALGLIGLRRLPAAWREAWIAHVLTGAVWLLAAYAFFFRTAGSSLAPFDADSLRTFTAFYLTAYGLAAALVGFAVVAYATADASALLIVFAAFSALFFYKTRIVPEHFWAARRFLAVILPGMLLLTGAAAFTPLRTGPGTVLAWLGGTRGRLVRRFVGLVLVLLLGQRLVSATQPLLDHVEYAGLIPHVEQLASTFGDHDLVIVESRNASDTHVLALPLAYVYARNVLVLASPAPPKDTFRAFLVWARQHYARIFFLGGGGGGTELLSRSISVRPIHGERFQVPEYEPALNNYPRGPRRKEFDLSVYEFLPENGQHGAFSLDVGETDDLYVRRFYAKERDSRGFTVRWTRDLSFISAVDVQAGDRHVTIWMDPGGRPAAAPAATVGVWLADRALGSATVTDGMHPYSFDIPADLAATLAQTDDAAPLRLETSTWNPSRIAGTDNRDLGVMVDRIEIR